MPGPVAGGSSNAGSPANLAPTSFSIVVPAPGANAAGRRPAYISSASQSIVVTLTLVAGNAPAAGITTTVTSALTNCSAGCTVPGPNAPPDNDTFVLTIYDGPNGTGHALSTATTVVSVNTGKANTASVTLLGIPKTFTVTGLPSPTSAPPAFAAGTPLSAGAFTVAALDGAGQTITGTYAGPVTVTTSDTSGTYAFSVDGATSSTTATLNGSTDTIALAYTGLATAPTTMTVSATGATSATPSLAPKLSPIVVTCTSSCNGATLVPANSAGATAAFRANETGWSNSPYNANFTATAPAGNSPSGCANVATVAPAQSQAFTVTRATGAASGATCMMTVADGAGQTASVTVTDQ
jgi:hypothetical protein